MRSLPQIVLDARHATGLWTAPDLAKFLGCSAHTVYRKARSGGIDFLPHHHALIAAVHPRNAALAAEYAAAVGTTLQALGLGPAEPTVAEAKPEHAALVLNAAADALDLAPRRVRPALAAAFETVAKLHLPVEGLLPHFRAGAKAKSEKRPR